MVKVPILRQDDGELLGHIEKEASGWSAQTIFGYVFARSHSQKAVEEAVRSQGLTILQGLWSYYDRQDKAWYPCILKEAFPNKVIVIRTNALGYEDSADYKLVTIDNPQETDLVKT
jgi:hypothetical protein